MISEKLSNQGAIKEGFIVLNIKWQFPQWILKVIYVFATVACLSNLKLQKMQSILLFSTRKL